MIALALAAMAQPAPPLPELREPVVAAAPRWSGEPDLCIITMTARDADGATIMRHLYRILGDGDAADRGPAFAAEQERRCASSPALDLDDPGGGGDLFMLMGSQDPNDGAIAVRIIRQAMREARRGRYGDIACDADPAPGDPASDCSDPRRTLAGLDLARVSRVDVLRRDGGLLYSVEAQFDLPMVTGWSLTLEAEVPSPPTRSGPVRLGHARLEKLRIFDVAEEPPPSPD